VSRPSENPSETLPSGNQFPLNIDQPLETQEAPIVTIDQVAMNLRKKKQVTIIFPKEENPLVGALKRTYSNITKKICSNY
jgi:hypothetical protein